MIFMVLAKSYINGKTRFIMLFKYRVINFYGTKCEIIRLYSGFQFRNIEEIITSSSVLLSLFKINL